MAENCTWLFSSLPGMLTKMDQEKKIDEAKEKTKFDYV